MFDVEQRSRQEEAKAKQRKRMRVSVDPENYEYTPAKKQAVDFYDTDVHQNVGKLYSRACNT